MATVQPVNRKTVPALVSVLTAMIFSVASLTGCFNTYQLNKDEFAKLQVPDEIPRTVTDVEGNELLVERETNMFVRTEGGRRYPVTAYNFRLTNSQLVASDRDTLLAVEEIDRYEVDLFDTGLSVLFIGLGVAAVGGLIAGTVILADSKALYQ